MGGVMLNLARTSQLFNFRMSACVVTITVWIQDGLKINFVNDTCLGRSISSIWCEGILHESRLFTSELLNIYIITLVCVCVYIYLLWNLCHFEGSWMSVTAQRFSWLCFLLSNIILNIVHEYQNPIGDACLAVCTNQMFLGKWVYKLCVYVQHLTALISLRV